MLNEFLSKDNEPVIREGDLYRVVHIGGETFVIRFGYYEDYERQNVLIEPMPIYPDFGNNPRYTRDGFPFVTKMQDACPFYKGKLRMSNECAECEFFAQGEDLLGICTCLQRRRE